MLPSAVQAVGLLGGVYALRHSAGYPSSVELPLASGGIGIGSAGGLAPISGSPLGCPLATGGLSGGTLGPVTLGMTAWPARAAFTQSSARGHRYTEFFCLSPNGIRVGFPSPGLLRTLAPGRRASERDRVVIALTANPFYALGSVRPGARLAGAVRTLHLGQPFHVGQSFWYLIGGGQARGVLKVRGGIVQEVGVAQRRLTAPTAQDRKFFRSWGNA